MWVQGASSLVGAGRRPARGRGTVSPDHCRVMRVTLRVTQTSPAERSAALSEAKFFPEPLSRLAWMAQAAEVRGVLT